MSPLKGRVLQSMVSGALASAALLALCSSAPAACLRVHASEPFFPSHDDCHIEEGDATWRVPLEVTAAYVRVRGADYLGPGRPSHGGSLRALLPVKPGEALRLEPGIDGHASAVMRGPRTVLQAEGGDRESRIFATPTALEVREEPAPGVLWPVPSDGLIEVRWYVSADLRGQGRVSLCVVPDAVGRRLPAAARALRQSGCGPGRVRRIPAASHRAGRVVRQALAPGSIVRRDTEIPLTVGRHQPPLRSHQVLHLTDREVDSVQRPMWKPISSGTREIK